MLRLFLHLLFGGVLVYAGAVKAWDPAAFLLDIRSFELLPDPWAAWLAMSLPWLEIFAGLAVIISCLGLFGLVSYVAEQRTKEIGIRKVVGASVFAIWKMLSKDFVVLVLIASFIGIPMASYVLSRWLTGFEYRTTISWWIPVVSALCAIVITLITVSARALRAARMNPVQSLRTE